MKRTPLKRKSKSPVAKAKQAVQDALRDAAIERDGGCIFRDYPHWLPFTMRECGPYRMDGELVLQADHLVTRSHSESYGDLDNIVCVCNRHHFYLKKQHGAVYWDIVRRHIGEERWAKVQAWEQAEKSHKTTHMVTSDWLRIAEKLRGELATNN